MKNGSTTEITEGTEKWEPCRRAYSREELSIKAQSYILKSFGPPKESESRDRWYERLGLLLDFIYETFPDQTGRVQNGDSN